MMVIGKLRPNKDVKRKPTPAPASSSKSSFTSPKTSRLSKRQKKDVANKLSVFERLPVELLQSIFLYSLNANLPLCSRRLLTALSAEHLKFEITRQLLVTTAETRLEKEERTRLLACRFFDWEFICKYTQYAHLNGLPILAISDPPPDFSFGVYSDPVKKYMWAGCEKDEVTEYLAGATDFESGREVRVESSADQPSLSVYGSYLDSLFDFLAVGEVKPDGSGDCARRYLRENSRDRARCFNGSIRMRNMIPSSVRHLEGLWNNRIPEKLLHGGWDDGRLRFLRLLVLFNGSIDWTGSSAGETATEGAIEAIKSNEIEVLAHLFSQEVDVRPTQEMLRLAISLGNMKAVFQLLKSDKSHDELDLMDSNVWKFVQRSSASLTKQEKDVLKGWLTDGVDDSLYVSWDYYADMREMP